MNKKTHFVILIVTAFLISLGIFYAQNYVSKKNQGEVPAEPKQTEGSKNPENKISLEEKCKQAGAEYKQFSNTCADSCEYIRNKGSMFCGQALTMGCDCGPDKCWNGESCEVN